MASYKDKVVSAPNPTEALLTVAYALDALAERIAALEETPDKGWGGWDDEALHREVADDIEKHWHPDENVESVVQRIEDQIASETDEDELRALHARLTLAKDRLAPPTPDPTDIDEGERVSVVLDEHGNAVLDLPKVDEEHEAQRREFAINVIELDQHLDPEFVDVYAKAGPLWLYYGNRDFVLGLTDHAKRAMIEDVEITSPKEAYEMAADILKSKDPGTPDMVLTDWKQTHA